MEELTIKPVNNQFPLDSDIINLMKYIAGKGSNEGKEKILYIGARGLSLDCEVAAEQIICMQEALRKDQDCRVIHLVIFSCLTLWSII